MTFVIVRLTGIHELWCQSATGAWRMLGVWRDAETPNALDKANAAGRSVLFLYHDVQIRSIYVEADQHGNPMPPPGQPVTKPDDLGVN